MRPVIALLSDFGTRDHYAGTMKGVMLTICPDVTLVDITHDVPAHDVLDGSLQLAAAARYFPPGTIFLAVVDPGVGSSRRGIAAEAGEYKFVAPDNGVLTAVLREWAPKKIVELTERRYARPTVSRTFEGRDRFAPAAGWLAKGIQLTALGRPARRLSPPRHPGAASRRLDDQRRRASRRSLRQRRHQHRPARGRIGGAIGNDVGVGRGIYGRTAGGDLRGHPAGRDLRAVRQHRSSGARRQLRERRGPASARSRRIGRSQTRRPDAASPPRPATSSSGWLVEVTRVPPAPSARRRPSCAAASRACCSSAGTNPIRPARRTS